MVEDERSYRVKLGVRIAQARGEKTQFEFASDLGISKSSLLRYEKGNGVPDIETVRKICTLSGVDWNWLTIGEDIMRSGEVQEQSKAQLPCPVCKELERAQHPQPCMVDATGRVSIPRWQNPDPDIFDYVPMAETKLSAGGGCFVLSENMEGYYAFRKNWLSRVASSVKNLVLMRVQGVSMHPTIQDRDTVMIDTGRTDIKEGLLYAMRFDSTIMIKRIAFRPGNRIQVISDNRQEYDPFEADLKDMHIIGQVIFFCRTFVPD